MLFEPVLPEGAPNHLGMLVDLEMPVNAGGKERIRGDYAKLLSESGFRLTRAIPTGGPLSIVETVPAEY